MASKPSRVTVGGQERYRVRWRFEDHWHQVTEEFRADAQRACDFVTKLSNKISMNDDRIKHRAYLVGSVIAQEKADYARTFGWAFEQYAAHKARKWRAKTAAGYRGIAETHLGDWCDKPVSRLAARDLNDRYHDLRVGIDYNGVESEPLAFNTVIRIMALAKAVLTFAHRNGWTPYDPHSIHPADELHFQIDVDPTSHRDAISQVAFRALLGHTEGQARTVVLLMATIGARIGEALALRVCDVDVDRRLILIRGTMDGSERTTVTKSERTGGRPMEYRPLPITRELAALLRPLVEGRQPGAPLFAHVWRGEPAGAHWHPNTWRNSVWYPMVDRARAAGVVLPEEMVPHVLRHSMGTWLAVKMQPLELMKRMRHANLKMTMRYYHDNDVAQAREFAALEAVFGEDPGDEWAGSMAA